MDVELNLAFLVAKDAYSQEESEERENVMAFSKDYMKVEAVIFLLQHQRQGGSEGCFFCKCLALPFRI